VLPNIGGMMEVDYNVYSYTGTTNRCEV